MAKKITPLLAEKYDISHKIFKELSDLSSRHILFSIIEKPKNAYEISREEKIPLSTVYKKLISLNQCSLIIEKGSFLTKGYVIKSYQSKIKDVKISITKFEPTISFIKNPKMRE